MVTSRIIMQMQQGNSPSITDTAERWVQIGANIGQMMGGAAKELGIAVNEFSQTSLGEVTMVMIIWMRQEILWNNRK